MYNKHIPILGSVARTTDILRTQLSSNNKENASLTYAHTRRHI